MQQKSATTRDVLRVFWNHVRPYKWVALAIIILAALNDIALLIAPLYYKKFFDIAVAGSVAGSRHVILAILVTILGINLFGLFIYYIATRTVDYFEAKILLNIQQSSFNYLLGHSHHFFANNFGGSLVQRLNRLARSFETIADRIFFDVWPLILRIGGAIIILSMRNGWIALILGVWVLLFVTVNYLVNTKWLLKYNTARAEKDSQATGVLSDAITNQANIQMFTGIQHEEVRYRRVAEEQRTLRTKVWGINATIGMVTRLFLALIEFALLFYMVSNWGKSAFFTIGSLVLVQTYVLQIMPKIWDFGRIIRSFSESFADAKEMVDILQTPYDIKDARNAGELKVKRGKIDFQKVSFHFHKTRQVLDNFVLSVRPGERVALVGHSGAGKSTLIKLLFRLYDPDHGTIIIDGQDIKKVTQASLRNAIGMVPQDPILFHRTLMDNIRYGRRTATDEEVIEAAKRAHCHEFIATLPEGYNTYVGERGIKLSGGERQRVAIARAFLKNAPILVLDEATSSLDSEVELLIQESLRELMQGKTVLVIAHRLSTIRQMDRIVVLEGGKVIDQGTHQDLLENQGLYASLWRLQSGGFMSMKDTE